MAVRVATWDQLNLPGSEADFDPHMGLFGAFCSGGMGPLWRRIHRSEGESTWRNARPKPDHIGSSQKGSQKRSPSPGNVEGVSPNYSPVLLPGPPPPMKCPVPPVRLPFARPSFIRITTSVRHRVPTVATGGVGTVHRGCGNKSNNLFFATKRR